MSSLVGRLARRLGPGLRRATMKVGDAVDGVLDGVLGGTAAMGPALRLGRHDAALGRRWVEQQGALTAALGAPLTCELAVFLEAVAAREHYAARGLLSLVPEQLVLVAPVHRPRFLAALGGVAAERPAAASALSRALPKLLPLLDDAALAQFLAEGLRLYVASPALAEGFWGLEGLRAQGAAAALRPGLELSAVQRILSLYAAAHCGADVAVRASATATAGFTDGRSVFLPARSERFGDERDFLLYRVWTARGAGFLEFGTLDIDLAALPAPAGEWPEPRPGELEFERCLRGFPNVSLARDLLMLVEGARVEACVRVAYPGVARDMDRLDAAWQPPRPALSGLSPVSQAVELIARELAGLPPSAAPSARAASAAADALAALLPLPSVEDGVHDSILAVGRAYPILDALLRRVDEDALQAPTPAGGANRSPREPSAGAPRGGASGAPSGAAAEPTYAPMQSDPRSAGLELRSAPEGLREDEDAARRLLERLRAVSPEADLKQARQVQRKSRAYEEMEAALEANQGPGGPTQRAASAAPEAERAGVPAGASGEDDSAPMPGEHRYPEWDHVQQDLKPSWVRLRERRVLPGDRAVLDAFFITYGPLVGQVRRSFEALRPGGLRRERGLLDGDELDLDRAIAERVERRTGDLPEGRVYSRRRPNERDVAVAFLVDLSSSTNELVNGAGKRIIEVEKEALLLTVEAVSALGDPCAVWGFSGYGRDEVAFYEAKGFAEPWDDVARRRVARMGWKMENRDGAAIRHATRKLLAQPARTRLLILLSDGRPLDCGCEQYRDRYAQEDTRAALAEARQRGVRPFCITVDPTGPQYLDRVYGPGGYLVIDRVERLPERLTAAWRRLSR